jgi:hypothetical protein
MASISIMRGSEALTPFGFGLGAPLLLLLLLLLGARMPRLLGARMTACGPGVGSGR